jgi:hypothetical protein
LKDSRKQSGAGIIDEEAGKMQSVIRDDVELGAGAHQPAGCTYECGPTIIADDVQFSIESKVEHSIT